MPKKALLGGLLVLAILGITGFVWLTAQASSAMRQVQAQVSAQGRMLQVAGGSHLAPWRGLELVLRDASISGTGNVALVAAREMRLATGWSGLFSSTAGIESITLVEPRFNLLIDRDGQTPWGPDAAKGPAIPIKIEHGTLAYLDERSGQRLEVNDLSGVLSASDGAEGVAFSGNGLWNGQRFNLRASVKSLARLTQDGSPADAAFRSPAIEMTFGGRLSLARGFDLAGRVDASIPDLRVLMRHAGAQVPDGHGLKFVSVAGALDASAKAIAVSQAKVKLDGMEAAGDVSLVSLDKELSIAAKLATERLDLDAYLPAASAKPKPLDVASLSGLNGNVDIASKSVIYRGASLGSGKAAVRVAGGRLEADVSDLAMFGGHGTGRIVVDGATGRPGLQVAYSGSGIDAQALLATFFGSAQLRGKGDIALSLEAAGASKDEMISTLKGSARFDLRNGALLGIDAGKAIEAASRQVADGWKQEPEAQTPFDAMTASFALADGIATLQSLSLGAAGLQASASGEIDFLRRAVDLRIDAATAGKDGAFVSFPVAIAAKGPWDGMRIYPDMPGILENPAAAFAALRALRQPQATTVEDN